MSRLPVIYGLGLSHRRTPVLVREKIALTVSDQLLLLEAAREEPLLGGLAYLGTCNRVEFYWTQYSGDDDLMPRLLGRIGYSLHNLAPHLYHVSGTEAAGHLGRVACGLESMVLGEAEILGQLDRAFRLSEEHGVTDRVLEALFQFALKAGRRARAETGINRHPVSVSSVAVHQAEARLGSLENRRATVLGLGETGTLVCQVLERKNLAGLVVVNRTSQRAEFRARSPHTEARGLGDLPRTLSESDLIFTCTGCPKPMISRAMVEAAMRERPDRPLLFVDLAVPHDVDPRVSELPNVIRIDVDALKPGISGSLRKRQQATPLVEAILSSELERFDRMYREMAVEPLINDLRGQAEEIRRREFQRLSERLPNLSEEEIAQVERFSRSLVQKLFHHPTRSIRREASEQYSGELVQTVRNLFQLRDRAS